MDWDKKTLEIEHEKIKRRMRENERMLYDIQEQILKLQDLIFIYEDEKLQLKERYEMIERLLKKIDLWKTFNN